MYQSWQNPFLQFYIEKHNFQGAERTFFFNDEPLSLLLKDSDLLLINLFSCEIFHQAFFF